MCGRKLLCFLFEPSSIDVCINCRLKINPNDVDEKVKKIKDAMQLLGDAPLKEHFIKYAKLNYKKKGQSNFENFRRFEELLRFDDTPDIGESKILVAKNKIKAHNFFAHQEK